MTESETVEIPVWERASQLDHQALMEFMFSVSLFWLGIVHEPLFKVMGAVMIIPTLITVKNCYQFRKEHDVDASYEQDDTEEYERGKMWGMIFVAVVVFAAVVLL